MKLGYILLVCTGHVVTAFLFPSSRERNVVIVLGVDNGGRWGEWHAPQYCAEGAYATGYTMKIEARQGRDDDTALNAIQLICRFVGNGNYGGIVVSGEGRWGNWRGWTECGNSRDTNSFLTSFRLQVEPFQGPNDGDDTAANFVKFKCRNFSGNSTEKELASGNGHGLWGFYGSWSQSCPPQTAICGLTTKIEEFQGRYNDDTALNDVRFFCCT